MSPARSHGQGDGECACWNRRKAARHREGFARSKSELAAGRVRDDGRCDGERLAGLEGAPAELELCRLLIGEIVRARVRVVRRCENRGGWGLFSVPIVKIASRIHSRDSDEL